MENMSGELSHIAASVSEDTGNGCVGTLTDGCVNGCVSCCFLYVLLMLAFLLGAIGLLVFLGWIFSVLFSVPGGA